MTSGEHDDAIEQLYAFDLFCGAGGSSWGAAQAGVQIVGGVDIDPVAVKTFRANFPDATVWESDAAILDLDRVVAKIGRVDLLLASPECTNLTHAKGNKKRDAKSKETALQVLRYARALKPRWIVIENVVALMDWWRYDRMLANLRVEGYRISELKLDSSDFGVPQKRRRLFVLCDRDAEPPTIVSATVRKARAARSFIEMNGAYDTSPLRIEKRAGPTLERADRATAALGDDQPFLLVYYGSDAAGGWQRLDVPLRTLTTLDRFALVKPSESGHVMRMLQVPELREAMGFKTTINWRRFRFDHGTRRDKVRLLGNAVCPPVMREIISSIQESA